MTQTELKTQGGDESSNAWVSALKITFGTIAASALGFGAVWLLVESGIA